MSKLGSSNPANPDVHKGLQAISDLLDEDCLMLKSGHEKCKKIYEKKRCENGQEATLFSLAWDVVGYETLMKENGEFQIKVAALKALCVNNTTINGKLCLLTKEMTSYSKGELTI